MTEYIGTANPGFAPIAMEELRGRWPGVRLSGLQPGETFRIAPGGEEDGRLPADLRRTPPVFLRHLFPVDVEAELSGDARRDGAPIGKFAAEIGRSAAGSKIAVQVRKSPDSPFPFSSAEARDIAFAVLREQGCETVARDADRILSIYAYKSKLFMGYSAPRDNLSDWPGGAVRFKREDGLISRAAFKLLEAEKEFGLPLERFNHALDLGAAPGGWTSVLLERGLKVTAVDPAEMDPALDGHPRLRHLQRNAAELSFPPESFDLLVCDMSWDPHRACRLVSALAPAMSAGASGIITLKLMYRKPLQTMRELVRAYEETFDVRRVKQLFHNREEVTIWVRRKA